MKKRWRKGKRREEKEGKERGEERREREGKPIDSILEFGLVKSNNSRSDVIISGGEVSFVIIIK